MPIDNEMRLSTWSRFSERIGVTLWTSFLAACLETLVFFAYLRPLVLGGVEATPSWLTLRGPPPTPRDSSSSGCLPSSGQSDALTCSIRAANTPLKTAARTE